MRISDWSSDVCSSDLARRAAATRYAVVPWIGFPGALATAYRRMGLPACREVTDAREGSTGGRADQQLQLVRHAVPLFRVGQGGLLAVDHRPLRREFGVEREEVLLAARRSEEHTSELQSLMRISYAVFCLKKKNNHSN